MSSVNQSSSYGTSKSSSTSTPEVMNSAQSDFALSLASALSSLGNYQYNWALNTYNNTASITDQQISNYLTAAQQGLSAAGNTISRYQDVFQPIENQLVSDAATYASTGRIQRNMGAAESATGQSMDQSRINAEKNLQSYGIDPSSGRYAELEQAQQSAKGAAEAAAGQQSELSTESTGRSLRSEAIQVGEQLPGEAVNYLNSAYQGISGAENSALGLANAGATLTDSASPYYSAAMSLKYPSTGQNTTSSSTSQNTSGSSGSSSGGGSSGSGQRSTGGGGNSGFGGTSGVSSSGGSTYTPYVNTWGIGNEGTSAADASASQSDLSTLTNLANTGISSAGGGFGSYSGGSSGGYSSSGGGSYGGYYAQGGGVLPDNPTTGGHVPRSASPSQGMQTDDIPARLNADEFVVPRDVALWKGQEFFQKLINDSRKARMGASAKPSQKAALPNQQPRFASRPMMGASNGQ